MTSSEPLLRLAAALPEELRAHVAGFAWTLDDAVVVESLPLIRLLHRYGGISTFHAMNAAASRGMLDIVRFLHIHRSEGCSSLAMNLAAAHGHVRVVQFLHRARHELSTPYAVEAAAKNGHLDVVQYLHRHALDGFKASTIDVAAANGHVGVVRFLLEHRCCSFSVAAMDRAMENGHDEIVDLLVEATPSKASRPFTKLGLEWATRNNHTRLAQSVLARLEQETSLERPSSKRALVRT